MKVIGRIEIDRNNLDEVLNPEYIGGCIVQLTPKETTTLKMLQDACEGRQWRNQDLMDYWQSKPDNIDMSEAFALVYTFATTRFAINDFESAVTNLKEIITRLDKKSEL